MAPSCCTREQMCFTWAWKSLLSGTFLKRVVSAGQLASWLEPALWCHSQPGLKRGSSLLFSLEGPQARVERDYASDYQIFSFPIQPSSRLGPREQRGPPGAIPGWRWDKRTLTQGRLCTRLTSQSPGPSSLQVIVLVTAPHPTHTPLLPLSFLTLYFCLFVCLLKYSWFTMLCWFLVYSKVILSF